MGESKRPMWIASFVIVVLTLLIYSQTFSFGYTLDDLSAISENYVTKQGIEGIGTHFTHHYRYGYWNSPGTLYRPLTLAFFALEWEIMPDSPGFYHFWNVGYYAAAGAWLFFTLVQLLGRSRYAIAFGATLLFIAHPVHVEAVANIKSRDEILAFLFCILALHWLWKFIEKGKVGWLIAGVFAYFCALLSKESAITFVAVFPLTIYFFRSTWMKEIKWSGLFLMPAALFILIRSRILGSLGANLTDTSPLDNFLMAAGDGLTRVCSAFMMSGYYLMKLVVPYPLVSDVSFNQISLAGVGDWRFLLALVVIVALAGFSLWKLKEKNIYSYCILYFAITFSIFSNILVVIGTAYGERLLFMPSLGFTLALAALVFHFFGHPSNSKGLPPFSTWWGLNRNPFSILAGIFLVYVVLTINRNPAWENSLTLYSADIQQSPNAAKLRYHYGLELAKEAQRQSTDQEKVRITQLAIDQYQQAISIYPTYHDAYGQMGLAFYRLKQPQKAMEAYQKSIEFKANNANVYSNMGIIYFEKGDLANAQRVYQKALEIDPRFVDARQNLGSVLAQQGRFEDAKAQFLEGLKYDPNSAQLHFLLGQVYKDLGDPAQSKSYLDRAAQLRK